MNVRQSVRNLTINRVHILISLFAIMTLLSCAESKTETGKATRLNELNCEAIDNEALELSRKAKTRAIAVAKLDEAIAKCAPDARRHLSRAILAVELGDAISEQENTDAAIRLVERAGDRCLIDLMHIEARALKQRRAPSTSQSAPNSCSKKRITDNGVTHYRYRLYK